MSRRMAKLWAAVVVSGCSIMAGTGPAWAQNLAQCAAAGAHKPGGELELQAPSLSVTPAVWSIVQPPIVPVLGSDGLWHLAYGLRFLNLAGTAVSLNEVAVVDARTGSVLAVPNIALTEGGQEVTSKVRPYPAGVPGKPAYASTLEAGQSGLMFFDVTFPREQDIPNALAHRVTQSGGGMPSATAVAGAAQVCAGQAVVLRPPLAGAGWLNGDGCCKEVSPHRSAVLPINGALRPAQRFAIDFLKVDEDGRAWRNSPDDVRNWFGFGAPILAAAPGRVVSAQDGLPNQPVGALPHNLAIAEVMGNYVVVAMDDGRYAFYAHMDPGSVQVKVGDTVQAGTILGRLGNSGNSDAPHLHFHVMDRASPLDANGLPFVFDRWALVYRVPGTLDQLEDTVQAGRSLVRDASGHGERVRAMPLTFDVAAFP